MGTLHGLSNKDTIASLCQKSSLFQLFDHVYVFGSLLRSDAITNDIDLLLVYSSFSAIIIDIMISIKESLEEDFHIPIDLTVLSQAELIETDIMSMIGPVQIIK